MQDALATVDATGQARSLLDPVRVRILQRLQEPDSAAAAARDLGVPRQRLGYHVRELVKQGLLEHVEDRRRGTTVEKLLRATARTYLIDPAILGPLGTDPSAVADRFSAAYLVAVAARTIREVAGLRRRSSEAGRKLATLTLQVDVRFSSPEDQNGFAEDLAECLADLSARYGNPQAPGGRTFRFVAQGYPAPAPSDAAARMTPTPEGPAAQDKASKRHDEPPAP